MEYVFESPIVVHGEDEIIMSPDQDIVDAINERLITGDYDLAEYLHEDLDLIIASITMEARLGMQGLTCRTTCVADSPLTPGLMTHLIDFLETADIDIQHLVHGFLSLEILGPELLLSTLEAESALVNHVSRMRHHSHPVGCQGNQRGHRPGVSVVENGYVVRAGSDSIVDRHPFFPHAAASLHMDENGLRRMHLHHSDILDKLVSHGVFDTGLRGHLTITKSVLLTTYQIQLILL